MIFRRTLRSYERIPRRCIILPRAYVLLFEFLELQDFACSIREAKRGSKSLQRIYSINVSRDRRIIREVNSILPKTLPNTLRHDSFFGRLRRRVPLRSKDLDPDQGGPTRR